MVIYDFWYVISMSFSKGKVHLVVVAHFI